MRIIISTVGTPTYELSYLVRIIQPTLNKKQNLANQFAIIRMMLSTYILLFQSKKLLQWYDVVNLYPSSPIKEATSVILEQLKNDEHLTDRTKTNH